MSTTQENSVASTVVSDHESATRRAWGVLLLAGVFEIAFAVSSAGNKGFTNLGWSLGTVAAAAATIVTLSIALKKIDVGIGYAVWTGIGATGAAIFGAILFHQPLTWVRVIWLVVIIAGVVWLKLASGTAAPVEQPGKSA